jgi:phosphoribosylformimino-5-aminoimidazole carboxamide ribotide isomerase
MPPVDLNSVVESEVVRDVQVIPVIDLMDGLVVRGVGGRRNEYRPIQSLLSADARPSSVARALVAAGFRETYVADLDAITKGDGSHFLSQSAAEKDSRPLFSWAIYEELLGAGLELWVDAGLSTAEQAREMAQFQVDGRRIAGVVAGLESLEDPAALAEMCSLVGPDRLIFSLDLKFGVPLAGSLAWKDLSAEQIAAIVVRAGVRRMIVLDLASVGMGAGVGTEPLCRSLRCRYPDLQIIAGGGVRGPADLLSLEKAGCDAALVASALHDGRLDARECAQGWVR